jgi:hypothetical protein
MQRETEHQQGASSERSAEYKGSGQFETEHRQAAAAERPGGDEESARRVRQPVSFGMCVAGTVAAFVAGFGILPSSTLAEKAFILVIASALSGAIIAGIGAWRSVKRFVIMAIFASLAFVCLAALAVAAQNGATASPTTHGSGQSSVPVTSPGYLLKYSQQFTLPGDGEGCQSISYNSYVLFSGQGPKVTPDPGSDSEPAPPWDMIMNCYGDSAEPDIEFSGSAATISGAASSKACQEAINTDPMSTGIKFATLAPGMQVCMTNSGADEAGNELILVTLKLVSTATYNTTWTATVWDIPASS